MGKAVTRRGYGVPMSETEQAVQWEYAVAPLLIHNPKAILDNFGADGWELVSVLPGPTGEQHVAYLKRRK